MDADPENELCLHCGEDDHATAHCPHLPANARKREQEERRQKAAAALEARGGLANVAPGAGNAPFVRFGVGARVEANVGHWAAGTVVKLYYREDHWPEHEVVPYQVELDEGRLIYAPADRDEVVRALPVRKTPPRRKKGAGGRPRPPPPRAPPPKLDEADIADAVPAPPKLLPPTPPPPRSKPPPEAAKAKAPAGAMTEGERLLEAQRSEQAARMAAGAADAPAGGPPLPPQEPLSVDVDEVLEAGNEIAKLKVSDL